MLLKDVDTGLDLQCTIAISIKSSLIDLAAKIPGQSAARIGTNENGTFIQLYFAKDNVPKNTVSAILANEYVNEKDRYYYVAEKMDDSHNLDTIYNMVDIPSAIISGSFLLGKELFLKFRFHSTHLSEVNSLLSELSRNHKNYRPIYLGPSPGLIADIEEANRNVPLSVVRFFIPVIRSLSDVDTEPSDIPDYIGEGEVRKTSSAGTKSIIYSRGRIRWAEPISEDGNIYLFNMAEPFTAELKKWTQRSHIPLMSYFGKPSGRGLEMTVFLPASEANDYIERLLTVASEYGMDQPRLVLCAPLRNSMWEWL